MANWCLNTVSFRGTAGQLEQVKNLFEDLQIRCNTEYKGHLPDFVKSDKRYIFDICCGDDVYYYCTNHLPSHPHQTGVIKSLPNS